MAANYTIEVRNNNVEKALRVLKKKLMKDGVMRELKERQYFQKPSWKLINTNIFIFIIHITNFFKR